MKRCSVCKKAEYCGAECQKAGWKQHKKTCAPPLDANSVLQKLTAALQILDWREALKWEDCMEELVMGRSLDEQERILSLFAVAHNLGLSATGSTEHAVSAVRIDEQRVELLGTMQRFRDQGDCLCSIANCVLVQGKEKEGEKYYQRARDIGAAHGFFVSECSSCQGLGQIAMGQGRREEAVLLFQNALAAAPLCEGSEASVISLELTALKKLTDALFVTNSVDDVEPLVERYRSAVNKGMRGEPLLRAFKLHSMYISARLHEVLSISIPFGATRVVALPLHSLTSDSVMS